MGPNNTTNATLGNTSQHINGSPVITEDKSGKLVNSEVPNQPSGKVVRNSSDSSVKKNITGV